MLTWKCRYAKIITERNERRITVSYEQIDGTQIGSKMRSLRNERGESMEDFANGIGVSASAVGMYENGYRIPRDEIKIRIAEHYGVTVESIFFPIK